MDLNPMPDERIEKAAIAIFAAQTNWAEPDLTPKTVKALWDGQMNAVRDSFRRLAKAALDSLEDINYPMEADDEL